MKWKLWAEPVLLLLLAVLLSWGTALERQQQRIAGELIRLHVVANSDSEADQAVKLQVRDAILLETETLLSDVDDRDQAYDVLSQSLDRLKLAADNALREQGRDETAHVTLGRALFGARHYDTFTLPGGYYDALRVTIGEGQGRNWWCVVYPQLCTGAVSEDLRTAAVMGGMRAEDALVISEEPEYQYRLKALELFENLLLWFRCRDGIPTSG